MIVIKLVGGLASQLHKYAVARSLAEKYGKEFKVDLSAYENIKENDVMKYGLPSLGLKPLVATKQDIIDSKQLTILGHLLYFMTGVFSPVPFIGWFSRKAINSLSARNSTKKFIFSKSLTVHVSNSSSLNWINEVANSDNCYIQAEFGLRFDIIESIRNDLKQVVVNNKISDHAQVYLNQIRESPISVSMHVRRGDYVTNKSVNDFHGVCGKDYYQRALKRYEDIENVKIFMFSDDLEWVEQEFKSFLPRDTVFVSNNEDYEDFTLMSNCSDHIIANSGFSSIAAWLSGANESNITSPARWFIHEETNKNQLEMLPKGWVYL